MITIDFVTKPKEIIPEYVTDEYGYKHLFDENGKYNSYDDFPAVVWPTGTKFWFKHGKYHRDNDLPAIVYSDGTKFWFKNGKCHRDNDLPAVICLNGKKEWWLNGKRIK